MDTELDDFLAEQETDQMRQEIDCTRFAMADKLDALEDRVMDSVHSAQNTVDESIQIAKDTVDSVRRTFDIKHQVEQHPWAMVGGSILAGLALGSLFRRLRVPGSPPFPAKQRGNSSPDAAAPPRSLSVSPSRPGVFDRFQEEIDKVKGLAVGYVMGLVRDSIKESVPQLASQISDVMNSVTTKLGGEPVQQHSPKRAKENIEQETRNIECTRPGLHHS